MRNNNSNHKKRGVRNGFYTFISILTTVMFCLLFFGIYEEEFAMILVTAIYLSVVIATAITSFFFNEKNYKRSQKQNQYQNPYRW